MLQMTLTRYNPFRDMEDFSRNWSLLPDVFSRFFDEPVTVRPWSPSVDIEEKDNEIVLKADIPGVNEKDLEVRLENGTLTLKGERKFEKEDKQKGYHRIERGYGSFVRSFALPAAVDSDKVQAHYHDGVLTVTLPKTEASKARKVKISTN
jgi:HSP20 family protein